MKQAQLNKQSNYEVGIFPIPGVVAFPFQKLELHVFEERYKRLVEDGVRNGRDIAISLAKSGDDEVCNELSHSVEVYAQSSSFFKPHNILSAGPFTLKERLPDGRYLIEIDVIKRVKIDQVTQDIPFGIAEVEILDDIESESGEGRRLNAFSNLSELCQKLLGPNYEAFVRQLPLHVFFNHDLSRYTFEVFKWCRLEPDQMQQALEMRDPCDRADLLISVISNYLELTGQDIPLLKSDRSLPEHDAEIFRVNFKNKQATEYTIER